MWLIPKEELQEIVYKYDTLSDVLRYFKINPKGGNARTLKERLEFDNIDWTHIKNNNKTYTPFREKRPIEEYLIENSKCNHYHLKKRLIEENFLENKCYICGSKPEWNGKELSMQLDHINGIYNDDRLENLRLLCPNCHSQTETFNGKKNVQKEYDCKYKCGNKVHKSGIVCEECKIRTRENLRKVKIRPDKETLLKEVELYGYVQTGRKYGVSDNAIRKWLKAKSNS
jgi:5-methylcytosine-specific restriction endonuclease McrA